MFEFDIRTTESLDLDLKLFFPQFFERVAVRGCFSRQRIKGLGGLGCACVGFVP